MVFDKSYHVGLFTVVRDDGNSHSGKGLTSKAGRSTAGDQHFVGKIVGQLYRSRPHFLNFAPKLSNSELKTKLG